VSAIGTHRQEDTPDAGTLPRSDEGVGDAVLRDETTKGRCYKCDITALFARLVALIASGLFSCRLTNDGELYERISMNRVAQMLTRADDVNDAVVRWR
jgi:hypothetical protein